MRRLIPSVLPLWLPLFLLTGVSWLFAPAIFHDHYGTLQLISNYEGRQAVASVLFRMSDVVVAGLLLIAVWRLRIWQQDKVIGGALMAVATLSIIDVVFTDSCHPGGQLCSQLSTWSTNIHVVESVVLGGLLFLLGIYSAQRYRHAVSFWFIIAQSAFGLLVLSGFLNTQQIVLVQYAYLFMIVAWLAWLVMSYAPRAVSPVGTHGALLRKLFAWWAFGNGMAAIVVSLTHHALPSKLFAVDLVHSSNLIAQHGVITGVFLLYIARHVYQGQRRAAWLLAILLGSLAVKYSIFTPSLWLLALTLISLGVLAYSWAAFDRNTAPLPLRNRAKDAAVVVVGMLTALVISHALVTVVGNHSPAVRNIGKNVVRHTNIFDSAEDRLAASKRTRIATNTLLATTVVLAIWSLFRPAKFALRLTGNDRMRATQLLARYSTSTEDYFKLWPHDKSYYFFEEGDGFVAYRVVGRVAFALADPVVAADKRAQALQEFVRFCRAHGWAVCFLLVQEDMRELYEPTLKIAKIGSSAVIDVQAFADTTSKDKWWRWQRNRAQKSGYEYSVVAPPHSQVFLDEIAEVSDAWLADGKHTEQGFALGYFDPEYLNQCRIHTVRDGERQLVAFANELPVYAAVPQRTVDLIRYRPGSNGTMPYLLAQLILQLNDEGEAKLFDLGFVPLAGVDSPLIRLVRRLMAGRFSSAGLEQFKNKFDPTWQANYIAYDGDLIDLALITANLEAALKRPA